MGQSFVIQTMEPRVKQHIDLRILELMNADATADKGLRLLMNTYQEKLYWHIRGLLKNHPDTDDVLQNTFIKIYRNIGSFKGDAQLYTWLYRIATNESLTQLQKHKKKRMASLDDEQTHPPAIIASNSPASNRIQARLSQALVTLPPKQRAVFQLRYFDEMSYEDMHQVTGTSVGALKASYHHAVKKIEKYLRDEEA